MNEMSGKLFSESKWGKKVRKWCKFNLLHLQSDLLGHPLSLVGQDDWVTVAASLLTRVLPQLKLLQGKEKKRRHGGE